MAEVNAGLTSKLTLNEKGGFLLISGKEKVDDNVQMFLSFTGYFRIFAQDSVLNPDQFTQNTTDFLWQYKNAFRLQVMNAAQKYLPFTSFYAVDIPVNYFDRTASTIYLQYRYNLPQQQTSDNLVTIKKVIE